MEERIEQLRNSAQTAGVYASRIADYFDVSIEHDGKEFVIEGLPCVMEWVKNLFAE